MAYRKQTAMRVWSHIKVAIRISHPALTEKIDIYGSRAVARYVQRPYTPVVFELYECKYAQNVVLESGCDACLIHNSPILSRIQL